MFMYAQYIHNTKGMFKKHNTKSNGIKKTIYIHNVFHFSISTHNIFACAQLYIHRVGKTCALLNYGEELFIACCALIICQAQQVQKDEVQGLPNLSSQRAVS